MSGELLLNNASERLWEQNGGVKQSANRRSTWALDALGKDFGACMKAIADVCVVPIGVGVSLSKYIVACEKIFREAGLNPHIHGYGTNVEGDWDEVMAAIKRCHERVHGMGAPRISTTIRLGTRIDKDQTIKDKVESVSSKLGQGQDGGN